MQFQVPQFLDVEDKIFGPLTLRQFLYLAAAAAISFMLFFTLEEWLWVICTGIVGVIAITLAFVKFNGRPALYMIGSMLKYTWFPKLYLWQYTSPSVQLPRLKSEEALNAAESPLQKLLSVFHGGAK